MDTRHKIRKHNHTTIIIMLLVATLLPLVFNSAGMIAGLVLAVMVLMWLLLAGDADVRNRMVLLLLAAVVVAMNGAFTIGVLTNGTWEF